MWVWVSSYLDLRFISEQSSWSSLLSQSGHRDLRFFSERSSWSSFFSERSSWSSFLIVNTFSLLFSSRKLASPSFFRNSFLKKLQSCAPFVEWLSLYSSSSRINFQFLLRTAGCAMLHVDVEAKDKSLDVCDIYRLHLLTLRSNDKIHMCCNKSVQ